MNNELTPEVIEWLTGNPKDPCVGVELLLRINHNRIFYNNVMRNPQRYLEVIEYNLRKILKERTKESPQVITLATKIAAVRGLDKSDSAQPRSVWQSGKRADHDELPAEVQKLYIDNADIMLRMRYAYTKMTLVPTDGVAEHNKERKAFANEVCRLDDKYRDNWNKYDHYIKGTDPKKTVLATDPRAESKNAAKLCNLLLGKYAKEPSPSLAERIKAAYSRVTMPTDALRQKMIKSKLL